PCGPGLRRLLGGPASRRPVRSGAAGGYGREHGGRDDAPLRGGPLTGEAGADGRPTGARLRGGRLAGRAALITGGSRGIGAAIAKAFAREGARVAFTYRQRDDAAREVVDEIERGGGEAVAIRADASSEEDARRAVRETVERFGRINVLVNNAGAIGGEFT